MSTRERTGSQQGGNPRAALAAGAPVMIVVAALGAFAQPACAAAGAGAITSWSSIGVLAGSVQPDRDLADYQWRTSRRAAWGVQGLAGARGFSGGVRLWNTRVQQQIAPPEAVTVRGTSFELVGRGRVMRVAGNDVVAVASGGRLHFGYDPDRVELAGGSMSPVVVHLAPIDEWIAGGGLGLERRVAGVWRVGIEIERRIFGLDTAHRSGEEIVERREVLGDWNARVELARLRASR